jgi:dipeptidyl aminopeptidase/acylaminoacyl peptidase
MKTIFLRGDWQSASPRRKLSGAALFCSALALVLLVVMPLTITSGRSDEATAHFVTLSGHTSDLTDAEFSPDGKLIVTASSDKTARIWDAHSGALLKTLTGHTEGIKTARFSPDGTRVLTSSQDATAKIWDVKTGKLLLTLSGHTDPLEDAEFSRDGRFVVTTARDSTARIWDSHTGASIAVLTGHAGPVMHGVFSPDGRRVDGVQRSHREGLGCRLGKSNLHTRRPQRAAVGRGL